MRSKGIVVSNDWVPLTLEQVIPGTPIKIKSESGGGFGNIIGLTPSGKRVMIKTINETKSVDVSELLIREQSYAHLLQEINAGIDPMMGFDQNTGQPDPEMVRINQYRARISRDQLELAKLMNAYTKKQTAKANQPKKPTNLPGTHTPQQMRAMQQQSAQNAQAAQAAQGAQGFPTMQQAQR